ncbi:MAG: thioesterase family protein [Polyangiales bacterium]
MSYPDWDASAIHRFRVFVRDRIPFNRFLGIEVTLLNKGFVRMELPFREEFVGNPKRPSIHGGVLSALIDSCGGAAIFTLLERADTVSTIDLRIDYLRPAEAQRLICEATVIRRGTNVAAVDMRVVHSSNESRLIAIGRGVYNLAYASGPTSDFP